MADRHDDEFTDDELREMEAGWHLIHAQRHAEGGTVEHDETDDDEKITKQAARYRIGSELRNCEACRMYVYPRHNTKSDDGTCELVEGAIAPHAICNFYRRKKGRANGGAVDQDQDQDQGDSGFYYYERVPKAGQTLQPVNARPMTGQAAMTALGIPDISSMTPDEQQMFALGAVPMLAAGPEARVAEETIPEAAQAVKQGIRAFHGSPHDFERFDLSRIGSGEGAQAYGHGLYFAENPQVAQTYREAPVRSLSAQVAADELLGKKRGRMYEVAINADPEHFLDLDKPLNEQSEHVKGVLQRGKWAGPSADDTGLEFIKGLAPEHHLQLGKEGIAGLKYLDQVSRWADDMRLGDVAPLTRNYVVFDDKLIDIIKKYGIAGLIAGGAAHFRTPIDGSPQSEFQAGGPVSDKGKVYYERINGVAPPGSFKLPHHAVHALGAGDPLRAGRTVASLFGTSADDPLTIHPDVVRQIGEGDLKAGHRVLQRFVHMLRRPGAQSRVIPQPDGNNGRP
jgi:hypothetical protein